MPSWTIVLTEARNTTEDGRLLSGSVAGAVQVEGGDGDGDGDGGEIEITHTNGLIVYLQVRARPTHPRTHAPTHAAGTHAHTTISRRSSACATCYLLTSYHSPTHHARLATLPCVTP